MIKKTDDTPTDGMPGTKPATPEQIAERKAAKLIAFTAWRQTWRAENPEGTKEERKAAWQKARRAEVKSGLKAVKALRKGGFTVSRAEA